jgi:hypothetical protein
MRIREKKKNKITNTDVTVFIYLYTCCEQWSFVHICIDNTAVSEEDNRTKTCTTLSISNYKHSKNLEELKHFKFN